MGIQVTSLSAGNTVVMQQETGQEKKPPMPAEQKAAIEQSKSSLPDYLTGTKKPAQDLQKVTTELERISLAFDRRLKFIVDHESREILIKVIDNETDKVIKVLPPEELQKLHSRIRETIGFLFDRMV
jgi:flagellar protein FlaG